MITTLDLSGVQAYLSEGEIREKVQANAGAITRLLQGELGGPEDAGWLSPGRKQTRDIATLALEIAEQIREKAEVFVLVGVGGSNRGARSAIETLGDRKVEIIYAGDNLSSRALQDVLERIKDRSTYLNVIAKDFNTLEPGIAFRILRRQMEERYGEEARERILVTGSRGQGQLYDLSRACGYSYLPFPDDMGGRFSVLSAVGLLPMAVAGVDIHRLLEGAAAAEQELRSLPPVENPAFLYAAARNLLFEKGFVIENLVTLEPDMVHFARWWSQLFGESEGKNQHCIFPTTSLYSEDLHAIGQYIQQGKRMVMETYLDARHPRPDFTIPTSAVVDGFDYLDRRPYDELNTAVYQAALRAHIEDGVPCMQFHCGEIGPGLLGELFYTFMVSCCLSAVLIGVNPFGQPGVEAYKQNMYRILGKRMKE